MTARRAEALPPPRAPLALILGRHQLASLVATAVDFSVMVACVSGLAFAPSAATVAGAASGAAVNFAMGRRWIFAATSQSPGGQALRYALVSAVSLALNAMGEYALAEILSVQFVLARVVVALCVGVAWNFPMQRSFVFGAGGSEV
jgi:putative flippase GtrA